MDSKLNLDIIEYIRNHCDHNMHWAEVTNAVLYDIWLAMFNNNGSPLRDAIDKLCIEADRMDNVYGKVAKKKEDTMNNDSVNHPSHYISKSGLETIDVLRSFTEGLNGIEAVCTGNALKYLCRWKHKNGVEDLRKAVWYIDYLIRYLEEDEHIIPENLKKEVNDFINKKMNLPENLEETLGEYVNRKTKEMFNPIGVKYVVKVPEPWFISKEEADRYIQSLHDILDEKGYVTVRDVKERAGIVPDTDDIRFGWTKVHTFTDNPITSGEFRWRVTIAGCPVEIKHELTDVVLERQAEEKPRKWKDLPEEEAKKMFDEWFKEYSKRMKSDTDGDYFFSLYDSIGWRDSDWFKENGHALTFYCKSDAMRLIDRINKWRGEHTWLTVADLKEIVNGPISWEEEHYGWLSVEWKAVEVRKFDGLYWIVTPDRLPIPVR